LREPARYDFRLIFFTKDGVVTVFFEIMDPLMGIGLSASNIFKYVLPWLCLLGLGFMVAGHLLPAPANFSWNRITFNGMVAILVFSLLYCVLGLVDTFTQEREALYVLFVFLGNMLFSILLSIAGLLIWFLSRFPLRR
jgi:hypothetical protein